MLPCRYEFCNSYMSFNLLNLITNCVPAFVCSSAAARIYNLQCQSQLGGFLSTPSMPTWVQLDLLDPKKPYRDQKGARDVVFVTVAGSNESATGWVPECKRHIEINVKLYNF